MTENHGVGGSTPSPGTIVFPVLPQAPAGAIRPLGYPRIALGRPVLAVRERTGPAVKCEPCCRSPWIGAERDVLATPGVHMEERSPGSFRLNVRGSTLRSPFGVRNIKVYWNNIPFTDPGGNTYLNQLSYYNINSIEVIKGPAGSLYGAGTGGAVLLNSQPDQWTKGTDAGYILGNYNLNSLYAQVRLGGEDNHNNFGYTHQTGDGYRDHTQMRRDVATWETRLRINERQSLQASVLYGDLFYQTPGGLTKTEYNNQSPRRQAQCRCVESSYLSANIPRRPFAPIPHHRQAR